MQYLITGGTGFIGSLLTGRLREQGHTVTILSRRTPPPGAPAERYVQSLDELPGDTRVDVVVNLAGASLAGRRWSSKYKRELLDSRLRVTAALLALIRRLDTPPAVLISGSAVGYYGHHGDEILDEHGAAVPGFAHELCAQWESAAEQAQESGVRVCTARLGVVLDQGGGALQQLLPPFRMGVGNYVAGGRQWFSWIHREDAVAAMQFLAENEGLRGAFNLTAPEPVTHRMLCHGIQRRIRTFITLRMPGPLMRVMLGEMADELLIHGQRVVPRALQDAGFGFRYPDIDAALAAVIGRA